jgi:hypothetical protein
VTTANLHTLDRLETGLTQLLDGMLDQMGERRAFLLEIGQLDDIWEKLEAGSPVLENLTDFVARNRNLRPPNMLSAQQRQLLGSYLSRIYPRLAVSGDPASVKAAEDIKEWLKSLGQGTLRLTLKAPKEETPLTERFQTLLRKETEEMEFLLDKHDHLFTCLDDVLKTAEVRHDKTSQHLAASMIYFLQLEGFKVDPYVKRLRRIQGEVLES